MLSFEQTIQTLLASPSYSMEGIQKIHGRGAKNRSNSGAVETYAQDINSVSAIERHEANKLAGVYLRRENSGGKNPGSLFWWWCFGGVRPGNGPRVGVVWLISWIWSMVPANVDDKCWKIKEVCEPHIRRVYGSMMRHDVTRSARWCVRRVMYMIML